MLYIHIYVQGSYIFEVMQTNCLYCKHMDDIVFADDLYDGKCRQACTILTCPARKGFSVPLSRDDLRKLDVLQLKNCTQGYQIK